MSEEKEYDSHGNAKFELDLEDWEVEKCLKAYMIVNQYCYPSICHFNDALKKGESLFEAMGSSVFNEWVNKACAAAAEEWVQQEKKRKKFQKLRYC